MFWKISGRALTLEKNKIIWSIRDLTSHEDILTGKYIVERDFDYEAENPNKIESGILDKNGYIVESFVTFVKENKISESAIFDNIIDAVKICEQDKINIENGIIKNYVNIEMEDLKEYVEENHGWKPECFYFVVIEQNFSSKAAEVVAFVPKWIFINNKIDYNELKNYKDGYHDFYCRELDMEVIDECLYSIYLKNNYTDLTKKLKELGFEEKTEMKEQIEKIYKLK